MGRVLVGTSGWSYPHWRGHFFPPKLPQRQELPYIAQHFGTVEVNGTFYSLTRPSACDAWRAAVPEDFVFAVKASRYLTYQFGRRHRSGRNTEEQNDRQVYFPGEVFDEFQRVVKTLVREDRIFISDRKLVKLYKLFRARAWLFSGGTVSRDDLKLLAYLGETNQEIGLLREKVPTLLGE